MGEARKLGLDQGDQVIRAHLTQKMDFLTDAIAASVEPEALQAFLGETAAPEAVENAIEAANARQDWGNIGVTTLLPQSMPMTALRVVDANFGAGFSAILGSLEPGSRSGPVHSAYGVHIVRVTDRQDVLVPKLEDIRDTVCCLGGAKRARNSHKHNMKTLPRSIGSKHLPWHSRSNETTLVSLVLGLADADRSSGTHTCAGPGLFGQEAIGVQHLANPVAQA